MATSRPSTKATPAMIRTRFKKPKLDGFNNLTKSLSFNLYDVCYAKTAEERNEYIQYIDEEYNATRLTQILTEVTRIIGANILNVARQDYNPQGASVTILISEEPIESEPENPEKPGPVVRWLHIAQVLVFLPLILAVLGGANRYYE